MFTLLGFMGLYTVLGILFLLLMRRELETGPAVDIEPNPLRSVEAR
jgi:cytochrome bd-type quinol oxidase subunit 1